MRIKTLGEWFAFFFVLLFLPAENRMILFDTKPGDWYGELQIVGSDTLLIVGKNSRDENVDLDIPAAQRTIVMQEGEARGLFLDGPSDAFPDSLVIVESAADEVVLAERQLILGEKYYFTPGRLVVLTQADLYGSCLMVAALMGGFLALGFLIARHGPVDESLI